MNLNTLPPELLYIIFQDLDDIDILNLSYTTTYLHDTAANEAYRRIKNLIGTEPVYHGNNCLWYIQLLNSGCAYSFIAEKINPVNKYAAAYLAMKIDLPGYYEASYIYKIDNVNYHTFIRYHHIETFINNNCITIVLYIEAFISNNCITIVLYMLSRPWFFYTEADYQSIYQSLFNKDNMDTAIEYMIMDVPCILNKEHGYSNVCLLIEHGYLSIITHVNLELFDDHAHKRWICASINLNQIHIADYLISHTPGSNRIYYSLLESSIRNNNIDAVKVILESGERWAIFSRDRLTNYLLCLKYDSTDYYFKLLVSHGYKYNRCHIQNLMERCIEHDRLDIIKLLCKDYVFTKNVLQDLITKAIHWDHHQIITYILDNNRHIAVNELKLIITPGFLTIPGSVDIYCDLIDRGVKFKDCQIILFQFCIGGGDDGIRLFRTMIDNGADPSMITDNQMILIAKFIKYSKYREMYETIMAYRYSMLSDNTVVRLYNRIRDYFVFGRYV